MRDNSRWAALAAQRATGQTHTACKTRVCCWCVSSDEVWLTAPGGVKASMDIKSETVTINNSQ